MSPKTKSTKKSTLQRERSVSPQSPDAPLSKALLSGELPFSAIQQNTRSSSSSLPIGEKSAREATRWMMENFGPSLRAAGKNTPFGPDILCAIACQETAYFWLPLLRALQTKPEFKNNPVELVDLVVARCVLDASGDHPDSPRSAFPKNTAAFERKYGTEFTEMLVAEANLTRAFRDFGPKRWVYKGYGIFQYDLQAVVENESFFREKKWYDFKTCLDRCIGELKAKLKAQNGDLWEAVRAYNGAGSRARQYRDNVKIFAEWTADEIAKLPATRSARDLKPTSRPRLSQADLAEKLAPFALDRKKHPLVVVGIRGYYLDTMGRPGVNDIGIYDDAIFIDSPEGFATFNGNTDPSRRREGSGFGKGKGMAHLKPGAWFCHKLDDHGSKAYGPYPAICQRLGKLTVIRDGTGGKDYEDTGSGFGINIHRGSYNGTSSEGCQTIHPDQWQTFISMATDHMKRLHGAKYKSTVVPYILIEEKAPARGNVINSEARQNLIRSLDIGPEPSAAREGTRDAAPPKAIPVSTGLIVGGNMLAFSESIAPSARGVVSLCLLFAQEAAKADLAAYTPDLWVERHDMVLKSLGWTSTGGVTQITRHETSGVSVHKAVIPLLTAALGPAATAGALILAGLNQLQKIDEEKPWITLFDKESRRFAHNEYRFVTAEEQGDTILLRLAALRFTAVTERVQFLFFNKKDTEVEFTLATRTLAVDPALLADIEPLLREKLLSRAAALIKAIDLPEFS